MKQSAAKTLGVAALGAAFAAAGAGVANAAPVGPEAAGTALDTVTKSIPAENLSQATPAATDGLAQGQEAVTTGLAAAQPAAEQAVAGGPTGLVTGLLGGLPVQGGLPTQGLPVNGVPVA